MHGKSVKKKIHLEVSAVPIAYFVLKYVYCGA